MISQADIQGHWVRDWIKAPDFEDHTTRVHWMQVGTKFADIRIPLAGPDLSNAAALADLTAKQLWQLAQAEGFAGHVTLEGNDCTWHRDINWHGTPDALDVGALSFDPQGRLIEEGVHFQYTELWQQQEASEQSVLCFSASGYKGYVTTVGNTFVFAVGKADKNPTASLISALANGVIPDGIEELFDGAYALGHWIDGAGIAALSTQPFCAEQTIVTRQADTLIWHHIGFHGERIEIEMESVAA